MQNDYRSNPNLGGSDETGHAGDYAKPLDKPVQLALPFSDNAFKCYDVHSDANLSNLEPPTVQGFSPDAPE